MIRKFNYTGRKRIKRSDAQFKLLRDTAGTRFFDTTLHLGDLDLPDKAHVYVEAYHRSGYKRFDFGSLASVVPPADRRLHEFANSAIPLFRVKVVDRTSSHGRILASVDKVRPESVEGVPAANKCLLHVEYDDLGHRIWQLDVEGDWPVLRLNQEIDEISMIASSDNEFLSLVYPEVFRQILYRVVVEDNHTDPDCDDDWPSLWLKMACLLPGISDLPRGPKAEREAWIDRSVEAFARKTQMLDKFCQAFQEGAAK